MSDEQGWSIVAHLNTLYSPEQRAAMRMPCSFRSPCSRKIALAGEPNTEMCNFYDHAASMPCTAIVLKENEVGDLRYEETCTCVSNGPSMCSIHGSRDRKPANPDKVSWAQINQLELDELREKVKQLEAKRNTYISHVQSCVHTLAVGDQTTTKTDSDVRLVVRFISQYTTELRKILAGDD